MVFLNPQFGLTAPVASCLFMRVYAKLVVVVMMVVVVVVVMVVGDAGGDGGEQVAYS